MTARAVGQLCLTMLLGCPLAARAGSYATSFTLSENPISEGGRWLNGGTVGLDWSDVSSSAGLAIGHQVGASYTDATALLAGKWGPDQTVAGTVHTTRQNEWCYQEVELRLRSALAPHSSTGYEVSFKMSQSSLAYVIIVRWNGRLGSYSYLFKAQGTQFAVRNSDVVSARISGNIITAYINGVQKAQADITSVSGPVYRSGSPGIGFNLENGRTGCRGTNGDYGLTRFTANDGLPVVTQQPKPLGRLQAN
jgi:hypothetical protein